MNKHKVKNGIDRIDTALNLISGARIGLITNPTGVDKNLISSIDILNRRKLLTCLFSPEHGIRGDGQAGEGIAGYTDKETGLTVHSLYGNSVHIPYEVFDEIDIIAFDIQDVGARYYTYASTLFHVMQDCASVGKKVIVFDRINPIGGMCAEGSILDRRFSSFVGMYPVAARHSLTIGEYARYINDAEKTGCDLTVIECEGWKRDCFFDETDLTWIPPSPNMPTVETALCYIGTCLAEGTNLSEGRGTTKPFEMIGSPWMDNTKIAREVNSIGLSGVKLRPCTFTPTFSKYALQKCNGIQLHITDRRSFKPFETALRLFEHIRSTHSEFEFIPPQDEASPAFADLLIGSDEWRKNSFDIDVFLKDQSVKLEDFKSKIKQYYLY